jgi:hypothetical protein
MGLTAGLVSRSWGPILIESELFIACNYKYIALLLVLLLWLSLYFMFWTYSSVGIALGYRLDHRSSRIRFPRGLGIFLFTTASRTALGPTKPPIQWVPGALSLRVKRPVRESDRSPPSSAEVKEWVELCLHCPNTPSWCGAQLKHRDNFTFTFYLLLKCRFYLR